MTQPSGEPNLRGRRLEQGLTMQQLAERCTAAGIPVSASEISRIERHIHTPRPALRKLLAELLDLTVADLGSGRHEQARADQTPIPLGTRRYS